MYFVVMSLDNIIQYTYIVGEGLGHVAPLRCLETTTRDLGCMWPKDYPLMQELIVIVLGWEKDQITFEEDELILQYIMI